LDQFHKHRKTAREAYRKFVLQGVGVKETPWEELEGQIYLGGREFLDSLKKRIKKTDAEIPLAQRRVRRDEPDEILDRVVKVYGLKDSGELLKPRRDGEARRVAAYWLRVEGGLGLREIGKKFGVSYTTVSHMVGWVRHELKTNEGFARKILNRNPKT